VKRISLLLTAVATAVAALVVVTSGGSAQTPGGRTLTFFEADKGSTFHFVDTAPRSPTRNLGSRRFRASVGDRILFSNPIFDHKGGTRIGTTYATADVVKGGSARKLRLLAHGVFKLRGGQLVVEALFGFASNTTTGGIVGGTSAYEGARGQFTSKQGKTGSQDTIHLLP
jgi:hypothetical protein